jgi:rRNA maturation endonuclease Nob1
MRTEIDQRMIVQVGSDTRRSVQCSGCGYEWKVLSFVEGVDVEICAVCGCITVRAKNLTKKRSQSNA